jgi:hypothetical protein
MEARRFSLFPLSPTLLTNVILMYYFQMRFVWYRSHMEVMACLEHEWSVLQGCCMAPVSTPPTYTKIIIARFDTNMVDRCSLY